MCLRCGWIARVTQDLPLRVANKGLYDLPFLHAVPVEGPSVPVQDEPVAWQDTTIFYGLPRFGHQTCLHQISAPARVSLIPFSTPEIAHNYCAACEQPLILINSMPVFLSPLEKLVTRLTSAVARHVALHHRSITDTWGTFRLSGETHRFRAERDWQNAQKALLRLQHQAATQPTLLSRTDLETVTACAQGMNIRLCQRFAETPDDPTFAADEAEVNRLWNKSKSSIRSSINSWAKTRKEGCDAASTHRTASG